MIKLYIASRDGIDGDWLLTGYHDLDKAMKQYLANVELWGQDNVLLLGKVEINLSIKATIDDPDEWRALVSGCGKVFSPEEEIPF